MGASPFEEPDGEFTGAPKTDPNRVASARVTPDATTENRLIASSCPVELTGVPSRKARNEFASTASRYSPGDSRVSTVKVKTVPVSSRVSAGTACGSSVWTHSPPSNLSTRMSREFNENESIVLLKVTVTELGDLETVAPGAGSVAMTEGIPNAGFDELESKVVTAGALMAETATLPEVVESARRDSSRSRIGRHRPLIRRGLSKVRLMDASPVIVRTGRDRPVATAWRGAGATTPRLL